MSRHLVVAAHGTASPAGRAVVEDCALAAAELLGVSVSVGYVDVCAPALADVVTPGSVVVPLFLASGYHVRYDVPAATSLAAGVSVTPALGCDPAIVEAAAGRLEESLRGSPRDCADAVVLASAGSSQSGARAEVDRLAAALQDRIGVHVSVAYLSGPGRTIQEVCDEYRAQGRSRIAVASHLLAPGVFLDRARRLGAEAGALAVSAELGTHPAVSTLVAGRYLTAVTEGLAVSA